MDVSPLRKKIIVQAGKHGFKPTNFLIHVSIGDQRMHVFERETLRNTYTVSTSRRPPSCLQDSGGTPDGLHRVGEKIGEGEPLGMVFKGRIPTGEFYWDIEEDNLITTRILWLEGLEPGHNQGGDRDSRRRYIYIHGTNREDRLGSPQSGGCVNLSNTDILELFRTVPAGTLVWIERE